MIPRAFWTALIFLVFRSATRAVEEAVSAERRWFSFAGSTDDWARVFAHGSFCDVLTSNGIGARVTLSSSRIFVLFVSIRQDIVMGQVIRRTLLPREWQLFVVSSSRKGTNE